MAQTSKFDKLNNLRSQAIPFEKYFGEMDLDDNEKERRVELAKLLDDMFFYYLAMLLDDEKEEIDTRKSLKEEFRNIVSNFFKDTINEADYVYGYIDGAVDSIIDTTLKNSSDEWYTSQDRASYLAEDNTNPLANYYQDRQALLEGKTHKTWRTILDGKERHSHFIANAQEVPIGTAFNVGNSKMMFPGDLSLGADLNEIVNCRCSCFYS